MKTEYDAYRDDEAEENGSGNGNGGGDSDSGIGSVKGDDSGYVGDGGEEFEIKERLNDKSMVQGEEEMIKTRRGKKGFIREESISSPTDIPQIIKIILASPESHGKGRLVTLTKEFARALMATSGATEDAGFDTELQNQTLSPIDISNVDMVEVKCIDALMKDGDIPEPELMYVFGGGMAPLSLDDCMPWQIRLTEMWHVGGDGTIRYQDYLNGLAMYSKCIQRLGK